MLPLELINIAYKEEIEIEPKVEIPELELIEKNFGPYFPLAIYRVPVYIALILKDSNQCRIRIPDFYDEEYLKDLIKREEENEEYQIIHPYFFELKSIIDQCYNVENKNEIKALVNTLKCCRFKKTDEGLRNIDARAINLNGLTAWEFNEVKEFMLRTMEEAKKLEANN